MGYYTEMDKYNGGPYIILYAEEQDRNIPFNKTGDLTNSNAAPRFKNYLAFSAFGLCFFTGLAGLDFPKDAFANFTFFCFDISTTHSIIFFSLNKIKKARCNMHLAFYCG